MRKLTVDEATRFIDSEEDVTPIEPLAQVPDKPSIKEKA